MGRRDAKGAVRCRRCARTPGSRSEPSGSAAKPNAAVATLGDASRTMRDKHLRTMDAAHPTQIRASRQWESSSIQYTLAMTAFYAAERSVATKLKCRWLRKVEVSVRSGGTEPGAAVRRPSARSADGPGVRVWTGTWQRAPGDPRDLSSGPPSGSSGGGLPPRPTARGGRPAGP